MTEKDTIYIIRNSEVLPSDGDGSRYWRSGLIAEFLFKKNYRIKWVMSNFDHLNKIKRKNINIKLYIFFSIKLLSKNLSF